MTSRTYTDTFFEGETVWPIGRIEKPDGTLLVEADLTTGTGSAGTGYDRYVYNLAQGGSSSTPATAVSSTLGGTASDVLETALTNDGWWKGGGDGYTFRDTNGYVPTVSGGEVVKIVYHLNTTSFGTIKAVFLYNCEGDEGP